MTLADDYLPTYDVAMRHERRVPVSPPVAWSALQRADLGGSPVTRTHLTLRGLRRPRATRRLTLATIPDAGFVLLGERAGREIAFSLVGRFWTPSGGRVRVTPAEFRAFAGPGHAKVVWTFTVEGDGADAARLLTETRVACVDAPSRHRFRLYRLCVRPFSGLIRREMLRAVAREAVTGRV